MAILWQARAGFGRLVRRGIILNLSVSEGGFEDGVPGIPGGGEVVALIRG